MLVAPWLQIFEDGRRLRAQHLGRHAGFQHHRYSLWMCIALLRGDEGQVLQAACMVSLLYPF